MINKIVVSYITDVHVNLAIENQILIDIHENQRVLFLYVNSPCVVLGRFQNPWIEANIHALVTNQIPLIRRQSGGGTVYQDLGNVNFSFLTDKVNHSQKWNHQLVVEALADLDIRAYATERGDIRLDDGTDRKISGSAFKQKKAQAFHHGTMLINTDLDKLNHYITSNKQDLNSKSIASVRSKVANIFELNPKITNKIFIDTLKSVFQKKVGETEYIEVTCKQNLSKDIIKYAEFLKDFEWKIKETPKFFVEENILDNLKIEMTVKKTVIEDISLHSDAIHPSLLNEIEKALKLNTLDSVISQLKNIKHLDLVLVEAIILWFENYFHLKDLPSL